MTRFAPLAFVLLGAAAAQQPTGAAARRRMEAEDEQGRPLPPEADVARLLSGSGSPH
jgi:hypothetical protein